MVMRTLIGRLCGSLREAFPRVGNGQHAQIRVSKLQVITASTVAGGVCLTREIPLMNAIGPWHGALSQDAGDVSLATVSSIRDLPHLASDVINRTYSSVKRSVLNHVDTEGGNAVVALTAVNIGVYLLWKTAPTSFMVRFAPDVADVLGAQRFYLFYGTAGVASSLTSLAFRRVTRSNVLSLGASGAVVSVLWLSACFFPDRRMSIIGMDKTLTMQELVLAYTVFDAAGLLGSLGKIDFAAHLGGALFGNSWYYMVRDQLLREQSARRNTENHSLFKNILRGDGHPTKRD